MTEHKRVKHARLIQRARAVTPLPCAVAALVAQARRDNLQQAVA